jgi:hypothetical protein
MKGVELFQGRLLTEGKGHGKRERYRKEHKYFSSQEEIERDGECQAKETPMRQAIR